MRAGTRLWLALTALLVLAAGFLLLQEGTAPGPVGLSVESELTDGTLMVQGGANVPSGAWVRYVAYREADPTMRVEGAARVAEGRYEARETVAAWPSGAIRVDAHFQMLLPGGREQPAVVRERYGSRGERLQGPGVVEGAGGYRSAVASATVMKVF